MPRISTVDLQRLGRDFRVTPGIPSGERSKDPVCRGYCPRWEGLGNVGVSYYRGRERRCVGAPDKDPGGAQFTHRAPTWVFGRQNDARRGEGPRGKRQMCGIDCTGLLMFEGTYAAHISQGA